MGEMGCDIWEKWGTPSPSIRKMLSVIHRKNGASVWHLGEMGENGGKWGDNERTNSLTNQLTFTILSHHRLGIGWDGAAEPELKSAAAVHLGGEAPHRRRKLLVSRV